MFLVSSSPDPPFTSEASADTLHLFKSKNITNSEVSKQLQQPLTEKHVTCDVKQVHFFNKPGWMDDGHIDGWVDDGWMIDTWMGGWMMDG